ncbi:hypothetical protein MMC29_005469 [Sticta canariensis]|nr:hypothetical protein [Sticta canariensis]
MACYVLRRTLGTSKTTGKSFMEVLSEAFHNYTGIMVAFLLVETQSGQDIVSDEDMEGAEPDRLTALFRIFFTATVLQLSKVYDWQEKLLLPMTIEAHIHIVAKQPLEPLN